MSFSEPLGQFSPNLAQTILGWRRFKYWQTKELFFRWVKWPMCLLLKEHFCKMNKIYFTATFTRFSFIGFKVLFPPMWAHWKIPSLQNGRYLGICVFCCNTCANIPSKVSHVILPKGLTLQMVIAWVACTFQRKKTPICSCHIDSLVKVSYE